jgi:hypothetical protein
MDHFYRTLFIMTETRNLFSAGRRHKNLGSEISSASSTQKRRMRAAGAEIARAGTP